MMDRLMNQSIEDENQIKSSDQEGLALNYFFFFFFLGATLT